MAGSRADRRRNPAAVPAGQMGQVGQVGRPVAWPLSVGMAVAGTAAVVASASTLAGLARAAGWVGWTVWLLPAALDVGGAVGGWCWLRGDAPAAARGFGRAVALIGATATLVGNAAGHLVTSGYLHPGPVLIVLVGGIPASVLVALAHLAALLTVLPEQAHPVGRTRSRTAGQVAPGRSDPSHAASGPLAGHSSRPTSGSVSGSSSEPADGDTRAALVAHLAQSPATVAELVRACGRSRTTVVGHLQALVEAGALARDDHKRYRPRPHRSSGDAA